jgi:hypothetical protein
MDADERYKLVGRTFFSLVAPQDMQNTLKTVAQVLSLYSGSVKALLRL